MNQDQERKEESTSKIPDRYNLLRVVVVVVFIASLAVLFHPQFLNIEAGSLRYYAISITIWILFYFLLKELIGAAREKIKRK